MKGITWHTFRHTFASRLVQHGADIVTVKELLGHSTIVVTMRYAHSNDESKRRAVAKLGAGDSDKIVTIAKKPRQLSSDSVAKPLGIRYFGSGGMGEWLKPAVLKTVNGETRSGVRIPLPPPEKCHLPEVKTCAILTTCESFKGS